MRRPRILTAVVIALAIAASAGALLLTPIQRMASSDRRETGARSAVSRFARGAAPPSGVARSARAADAVTTKRPFVVSDDDGRVRIPLTDRTPFRLPAAGVPPGWDAWAFAGAPDVELLRDEPGLALRLRSDDSSFAIYRDVVVDLDELPILTWAWKAIRLPGGGDVRHRATDDQAAQIYLVFPRWPSPRTQSDVVGYVWDTTAPVGTTVADTQASNVRVVVVESGAARLGAWQRYSRDVRADYQALFGRRPPRVGIVAVMIDSNDTHGRAEALVADIAFERRAPTAEKSRMIMLR